MATITITHTRAEGTLIEGSRRGDGVWEILLELRGNGQGNWRSFRSLGQLGLGQSRDKAAQTWKLDKAAEALREAGHEVTVEIDDTVTRPFAEAEADRYDRAEDRADYHQDRAAAADGEAAARWEAERAILDGIPMGQPILVGHHSEGRHRRDLARADNHARKGLEAIGRRDHHEGRAAAAARYQAGRESIPTTLRRIAKLEADERRIVRRIEGWTEGRAPYRYEHSPATGPALERCQSELAALREQLEYWRKLVADAEAAGVKVWSRADFARGDFALRSGRWFEVIRVNAKSLTVPPIIDMRPVVYANKDRRLSWTDTVGYDDIRGRRSAEEMAAAEAAG